MKNILRAFASFAFLILLLGCEKKDAERQTFSSLKKTILTDTTINYEAMSKGFHHPPDNVKILAYWMWLNGQVTKESITRELEGMKAKGYGGAVICDVAAEGKNTATVPHGKDFATKKWIELLKHAIREADRLNLELSLNGQSGWNFGGPSVTPKLAMKKLVWTETTVKGPGKTSVKLVKPDSNLFYKDVIIQAYKSAGDTAKYGSILNWELKSFNKSIGSQGIYPLEKYRIMKPRMDYNSAISKKQIINLSSNFKDSELKWHVPKGKWTVVRYGMTDTGERPNRPSKNWDGLNLDHLSKNALDSYYQQVLSPIIQASQKAGHSLKYLHSDSWEMGVVSWTQKFQNDFKSRRGYNMTKYMPVLTNEVVGSREESNRFLFDFRETIGDLVAENHYRYFSKIAHQDDLLIHPEAGGPHAAPIDGLYTMSFNDIPMGEYWARSNTHRVKAAERLSVRQSASVAHTNGKRFVMAEGPTSLGPQWERAPKDLKGVIDRVFSAGVNRIVWHDFSASPKEFGKPGNSYFAGTHLNPNVTWWDESASFINYLNRTSYLLSQGLFVGDVLCYYGNQVPNFVFMKNEVKELNFGYDWDKCAKNVVLNRLEVKNHRPTLPDGMSYAVLRLPDRKAIDLEVLRKVEELVQNGATVIGPRPERATGLTGYPESDNHVKAIAGRLWGDIDGKEVTHHRYGEGKVIYGEDINKVLKEQGVIPDLIFTSSQQGTKLDYIHRSTHKYDIYFVVNRLARQGINDFKYRYLTSLLDRYEQVEVGFRITGKVPKIWDPMTGEIKKVATYRVENGRTYIPLHLAPEGSKFIIFRNEENESHIKSIARNGKDLFPVTDQPVLSHPYIDLEYSGDDITATVYEKGEYKVIFSNGNEKSFTFNTPYRKKRIKSPWDVSFDPKWGGPKDTVFHKLKSWTKFSDSGIKYYSGTATYKKNFSVTQQELKDKVVFLDLGNVQELAEIHLNGNELGVQWKSPFRVDITDEIKAGPNTLQIKVTNLWPNRLIGDSRLPEEKKYTQTNITKFDDQNSEKYLRTSGLLGPVKIIFAQKVMIK